MANSAALQMMQMRQIMVANGDEPKKIWATEYGQPASIGGAAKQNEFVADMLLKWQELPFAGPMFIYTTRDRKTGSSRCDETLGIYETNWTPKAVQQTVKAGASGAIAKSAEFQRFTDSDRSGTRHRAVAGLQDQERHLGAGANGQHGL